VLGARFVDSSSSRAVNINPASAIVSATLIMCRFPKSVFDHAISRSLLEVMAEIVFPIPESAFPIHLLDPPAHRVFAGPFAGVPPQRRRPAGEAGRVQLATDRAAAGRRDLHQHQTRTGRRVPGGEVDPRPVPRRGVGVWCGGMLEAGIGRAANAALAALPGSLCQAISPRRGGSTRGTSRRRSSWPVTSSRCRAGSSSGWSRSRRCPTR